MSAATIFVHFLHLKMEKLFWPVFSLKRVSKNGEKWPINGHKWRHPDARSNFTE